MNAQRHFNIVLVCTGNICRSPMAEGILRDSLSPKALSFATVSSAGTGAIAGLPASEHSVTACDEAGIDIASHRSRPLSRYLIEESDLLLTMEEHHSSGARSLAPDLADRVHVLEGYGSEDETGRVTGVPDPIGGSLDEYRSSFRRIQQQINNALPRIEREILAGVMES
jgi:protein-tyrosine-phosphatase